MFGEHTCTVCCRPGDEHPPVSQDCWTSHWPPLCCRGCDCRSFEDAHLALTSTGVFRIKDRGTCYSVNNPGGLPEPNVLRDCCVLIDDQPLHVIGVETFAICRPYPEHLGFGLLVAD